MRIFVQITERIDLVVRSGNAQNSRNFIKGEMLEFSTFKFSLQLMFNQISNNLIVCLIISQKLHTKVAQTSQHVVVDTTRRFGFSQTEFKMRRAKTLRWGH